MTHQAREVENMGVERSLQNIIQRQKDRCWVSANVPINIVVNVVGSLHNIKIIFSTKTDARSMQMS